ncbi:MAG: hypothetical protein ACK4ZW_11065 [Blastomonas sp.]
MTKLLYAADARTVRRTPLWVAGLGSALLTGLLCAWISGDAHDVPSPRSGGTAVLLPPVFLVLA